jgi:hypothetical protein
MRTKKIKVHAVSIDVDETATHWVVYVSPGIELQALGINPLRAKRAKCRCDQRTNDEPWELPSYRVDGTCKSCRSWTAIGAATYMRKLLRSYPKVTVEIPVPVRSRARQVAKAAA